MRGYLNGVRQRDRWPGMDKDFIIAFAEEKLRQLESIESLNSIGAKVSKRMKTVAGVGYDSR